MLAFSLWQPWATLVMAGAKPFAFRSWPLRWGAGIRYAIHAAGRRPRQAELAAILDALAAGQTDGMGGTPVNAATLFACADPAMWANPVADPHAFAQPIPAKGRQCWWDWTQPKGGAK